MKKTIAILMILAALVGAVYASAQDELSAETMESAQAADVMEEATEEETEEESEVVDLFGEIIEITEEYVLLDTPDLGHVQVNLSEDTVIEGVEALELGQTAVVLYNGQMTRSLPPQITAMHIGVYAVSGVITEVMEDRIVIEQEETGEEIIITLPGTEDAGENEELIEDEQLAEEAEDEELTDEEPDSEILEDEMFEEELAEDEAAFHVGDAVIVYTNGVATMSLPPQMNALAIVFDLGEPEDEIEEIEELEETEETEESDETVG